MAREAIAVDASNSDQAIKFSFDPTTETLSANKTFTVAELEQYNGFAIDPNGARDITLPAEAQCKGMLVMLSNEAGAAEVMTVKNDAGTTILTPTQNEGAILWCDGTAWYGIVGATS
jgi:hypothetical protein